MVTFAELAAFQAAIAADVVYVPDTLIECRAGGSSPGLQDAEAPSEFIRIR